MNERNPENVENILDENIVQNQNDMELNNVVESDTVQMQSNDEQVYQNIEDVVQDYFTQPAPQPVEVVKNVQPIEQEIEYNSEVQSIEPEVAPVAPLPELEETQILNPVNIIDDTEQNFNLEDANRVTQEHPDAKITLNRESKEPEKTTEEIANVEDLKSELKSNTSLKFILILGVILFVVIMILPYISNLLK